MTLENHTKKCSGNKLVDTNEAEVTLHPAKMLFYLN